MQPYEELEEQLPVEGAFCDTTKRIVIISPYPATLRSLVLALTVRCYDVLLFHSEHDPVLSKLQGDLLIVDRTKGIVEISPALAGNSQAQLILVDGAGGKELKGDALPWPCPVDVALAKIEELSTQSESFRFSKDTEELRFKDIAVDLKRMIVTRGSERVELTKTEFDLLKVLLQASGGVLSRQELLERVWGEGYFGGSNSVDVHIKSLRQKLADDPRSPKYIVTVRGVGYRITDESS
ncbi:winged helix-turn-helix domain-containing protein [Paenibacillus silviterrae]|uniref:winged helix-turn-helix domain-containing protein n=1 Tax=Paenibacillus silviterrae TaxID=3242194 RepID=UPI0025439184|nr:winged helix-turn-helix domain-containing protein [Paenibacillus chinjuensis]